MSLNIILGALYDFLGYLTTGEESIDASSEWLESRGFDLNDPTFAPAIDNRHEILRKQ